MGEVEDAVKVENEIRRRYLGGRRWERQRSFTCRRWKR